MNGVRLLLDTNIIIYYLKGVKETKSILNDNDICVSYVTAIETIGYWKNTKKDISSIKKLFTAFEIIYTDEKIMNKAIDLRLTYKLKTPDSIIAATALVKDIPLVTADKV